MKKMLHQLLCLMGSAEEKPQSPPTEIIMRGKQLNFHTCVEPEPNTGSPERQMAQNFPLLRNGNLFRLNLAIFTRWGAVSVWTKIAVFFLFFAV